MRLASLVLSICVTTACACLAVLGCASDKAAVATASNTETSVQNKPASKYPAAKRGDVVDDYHGIKVADPYRALEDPDSEETKAWVAAENDITFGYLKRVPSRDALKARLTELWNYERYSPPSMEGLGKDRRMFFYKNDGLQNQAVLKVMDPGEREARVLLDPNTLATDGTVALSGTEVSHDGKLLAYSVSSGGSDWQEWHVRNVATGADLPDVIKWSKFSRASWAKDNRGFFYSRFPEPKAGSDLEEANYFHAVYFHKLGDPQEKDALVIEDKTNKTWGFDAHSTDDGKYLIVTVWDGTDRRTRLWYAELGKKELSFVKLFDAFDAAYAFIGNKGTTFFIQTDLAAPRQRLVAVDIAKVKAGAAPPLKELIAQHSSRTLAEVRTLGGGFLLRWLENAHDVVTIHNLAGKELRAVALPTIGSTASFAGKLTDNETYYSFTSFTYPSVIYKLDLKTGTSTLWKQPQVKFNPDDFETTQVTFASKDGTKVPMFIVKKKGLVDDGKNPTYLYGYGGFNIALTPAFSVPLIAWLERGGVFAQPSLRGGGEFGEEWHQAGMLDRKQNVFDDFAAAAEHLIATKVTSKERLAIGGGSNGGLLVGASITQRPDLFGAAVAQVGVMDMLRFHKFTIGHAWVSDYGSADDAKMFPVLVKYSPLHNLKAGTAYPATLITTADHDDRVVPAHSFKFAAALQAAQGGDAPVLIRVDTKAGHGAGKPTTKLIEEATDTWAFLFAALGVEQLTPAAP